MEESEEYKAKEGKCFIDVRALSAQTKVEEKQKQKNNIFHTKDLCEGQCGLDYH